MDIVVQNQKDMWSLLQILIFLKRRIFAGALYMQGENVEKAKAMSDKHLELLVKYILKHELEEHITIKGFVSNGNITYLYKHAAGLIMPTYFGPTNKYAMPEQIGDAGLLFNPDFPEEIAACITKIWNDEGLRQEMIRKGHQRINRWTQEAFGRKLQRIIEAV